jgi:NTE family protein
MDQSLKSFQGQATRRLPRSERCGRIALVLQGGGALGAYQAGVYQALQEAGLEPDWVSGVSIGAINGAIIAGNPPALRLQRLRTFWERITERKIWNYTPDGDVFRRTRNAASSWLTILHGQPSPWLSFPGARTEPATTTAHRCARPCSSSSVSP